MSNRTEKQTLDIEKLPRGMSKKEFISLPEMKGTKSLFLWAGIIEILTGILTFSTVGQLAEYQSYGYDVGGQMTFYGVLAVLDIILGVILIVTRSATVAIVVGIESILFVVVAISSGGTPGAGIIVIVLALIGAVRFNKMWKAYSAR